LRFRRYAIGDGHLSGEVLQQRSQTILRIMYDGNSPVTARLAPSLPAAARVTNVQVDGKPVKFSVREFGSFVRVEIAPVTLRASQQLTFTVDYNGGIGIVPPTPHPQPGERTSSLKILDAQSNTQNPKCLVQLILAGLAGRTCPLQIITTLPNLQAAGLKLEKTETGYILQIPFEGSNPGNYVTRQVCLAN
jgi:hypothetical protein